MPLHHHAADAIRRYRPIPLFIERMSAYWVAIWKCWRTVLDWTVWLYILIPALWVAGGIYSDMVRNSPEWLYEIPPVLPLAMIGLLQLAGKLRIFTEPGDGLFLHRNRRWTRALTIIGCIYGWCVRLLISVVSVAVLSPMLLKGGHYSGQAMIVLVIWSTISGLQGMLIRDHIARMLVGWRRAVLLVAVNLSHMILFIWGALWGERSPLLFSMTLVLLTILAFWQVRSRSRAQGTLFHELEVERDAYVKSVGWILRDTMEKKPMPRLRRPLMFTRSQPLIAHKDDASRLADNWMKVVLRRMDLVRSVLSFIGVGAAAVLLTPIPLAGLVWLMLPLLLIGWVRMQWNQWLSEPYLTLFHWEDKLLGRASRLVSLWVTVPATLIWSLIIGIRSGLQYGIAGWFAIMILPVIGYFWIKLLIDIFTSFQVQNRRKSKARGV